MKKNQKRRTRRSRPQQLSGWVIPAVVLVAVVFTAGLVWLGNRPASLAGEAVTIPTSIARSSADSTALGPPDAPVLVEEFSDFQ